MGHICQYTASDIGRKSRTSAIKHTPLGEYEYHRRQMQEERKSEYNQYLAAKPPVPMSNNGYSKENVQPAGGDEGGLVSKMGTYEDSRRRLREERNREYNDFLAQQRHRLRGRYSDPDVRHVSGEPAVQVINTFVM